MHMLDIDVCLWAFTGISRAVPGDDDVRRYRGDSDGTQIDVNGIQRRGVITLSGTTSKFLHLLDSMDDAAPRSVHRITILVVGQ
jgi:hypothetical protein